MTFEELGLKSEVLKSLQELGFEAPTPIQEKAIPHLLGKDSDFVGLAQTGTGKTAAFGLPLVNNIENHARTPQGLVICPTRELCLQIAKDLESYSKHLKIAIVAVYGGTDIRKQMSDIKRGASVIVATPGRLMDLINRKAISLADVEYVVLDEADEMLNMGFKEDIDAILETTPEKKNVWLFSATMPAEVARIAKTYMQDPLEVAIGHKNQSNENIDHIYYVVKERDRYAAVKRLIDFNPEIYGLIFCRTRQETGSVAEKLAKEGYNAEPLHGDLSQAQRDRVMDRFRKKDLQILVATDVAARGLDIDNITHVINYNLPDDIENYTHRSGRTARAGRKGESLVLINTRESGKIRAIERQMRTTFTLGTVPNAEEICEIQLLKLINKVIDADIREKDIQKFMPTIMAKFEDLSKEEVIKHFVSTEFNRFIEYYERAGDLNAAAGKSDDRGEERGKRRERDDETESGKTRFFVSIGRRDGLNPGGLLRLICDATGLNSASVGRIDIMTSYSFFEADNEYAENIIAKVNGSNYEGHDVSIEITKNKPSGNRSGGGGGRRDGGSFGGKFSGNRDGGGRDGGFKRRDGGGSSRDGGARREGGFNREGSSTREGGASREGGSSREGGFGNRSEGGRSRDGGSGYGSSSRSEGGNRSEGGRSRDGGSGYGSSSRREGGRSEGGSRREGGSSSSGGGRPRTFGKPFNKNS
ncbi:MAG: DEAD/DEAH box helicase [Crocinitomicaceae bacterium]|nr:DEAD/DEAH box helicase [Crocinitomicaceae bacterium]MDP4866756.1 DEAD/DEAH box helicase [Crocinitomicaceae bacterium]MDP5099020.1 DEAD/DEAH box helicase [Crocinitomicaceae bacterium]